MTRNITVAPRDGAGPQAGPGAVLRPRRPSREEAEAAVRTLIAWAGDDPDRLALAETPRRVAEAYQELFKGYRQDPVAVLGESIVANTEAYSDIVLLRDIRVESHCEHHIVPFIGRAHVAYLPGPRLAGLSRIARVVEVLAKRLQTQEALTAQIADAIEAALDPTGVAVMIEAEHQCMASRGVQQPGVSVVTTRFLGAFDSDAAVRDRFLALVGAPRPGKV